MGRTVSLEYHASLSLLPLISTLCLSHWLDTLLLISCEVWEGPLETIFHTQSGANSARLLFTIIGCPQFFHNHPVMGVLYSAPFLDTLLQLTMVLEEMIKCITLSKQGSGLQRVG